MSRTQSGSSDSVQKSDQAGVSPDEREYPSSLDRVFTHFDFVTKTEQPMNFFFVEILPWRRISSGLRQRETSSAARSCLSFVSRVPFSLHGPGIRRTLQPI